MKKKKRIPFLVCLFKKLAPKAEAKLIVEPEWGIAAQIIYNNGVTRSLHAYSLDLNHIGSSSIAKDKDYAKFFMKKKGYPVAEGRTFFEKNWAETVGSGRTVSLAPGYAEKLGYPVIVKPNSKSQGMDVVLAWNKKELISSLVRIFKNDKVALVEKYLPGKDYRIIVLDGRVISAYERVPLSVTGDGRSSVLKLFVKKQKDFIFLGRDTKINFKDERTKIKLTRQELSLKSVIPKGQKIYLLDNANLSSGGDAKDATGVIHGGFKKIAVNLIRDMGLRMAGVDIMVTKGDITQNPKDCSYYIIEINSAPGLDHYVTTGKAQRKIVEDMYLKILKALGKKD